MDLGAFECGKIHSPAAPDTPTMKPASQSHSPAYGRRLIPQIIDDLAAADPDRVVFSLATLTRVGEMELREVSACTFSRAVDKTAWWLYRSIGNENTAIEPVGYIGPREYMHF